MLKVAILTSKKKGYASSLIPLLIQSSNVDLVGVFYSSSKSSWNSKTIRSKVRKIKKIGLLGALNGYRIREWFVNYDARNLDEVCQEYGVNLEIVKSMYGPELVQKLTSMDLSLGLSLGNGYIPKEVFEIPRSGFVNIHTELLPNYRNGQSIIWPIHNGETQTGFTIHRINEVIDRGDILYQEVYPIVFERSLKQTVKENLKTAYEKVPLAFLNLCEDFAYYDQRSIHQTKGNAYTTPTIKQFLTMLGQNYKCHKKANRKQ